MNIKNKMILSLAMFYCSMTTAYAFTCSGNPGSELHLSQAPTSNNTLSLNASSINDPNNWETDFGFSKYLTSSSLITCSGMSNPSQTTGDDKRSTFNAFKNSNISTANKFQGLLQYYKIQGTTNNFLNENGYIAFWYMDNRTSSTRFFIGSAEESIHNPANPSYTQGIRFNEVRFYFTKAPTEAIPNTPINIGTVTMQIKEKGTATVVTTEQPVQIYINVAPVTIKTCNLNSQTVTLPTLKTTDLQNSGAEAGATNFTITAKCEPKGVARTLTGKMMDNHKLQNTTYVLTNTNSQSNVGIKIQDMELNRPIYYGSNFSFGTTSSSLLSTETTKPFRATYYKMDNKPTVAGPVRAQAMITVTYE